MLANASRQMLRTVSRGVRLQTPLVTTIVRNNSITSKQEKVTTTGAADNAPLTHPPKDSRLQAMKENKQDDNTLIFHDVSVKQILAIKQGYKANMPVSTVSKDDTVYEAVKRMNAARVGALVVLENNTPVGMISERDYLNKVVLRGFSSKQIKVADIMTSDIVTVTPEVSAGDCMELMTKGRFRHLPVVDKDDQMLGIVSIGDLVKTVLDQQKETINYLKEYIERTY